MISYPDSTSSKEWGLTPSSSQRLGRKSRYWGYVNFIGQFIFKINKLTVLYVVVKMQVPESHSYLYCGFININGHQLLGIWWKSKFQGYVNSWRIQFIMKNSIIFNFVDQLNKEIHENWYSTNTCTKENTVWIRFRIINVCITIVFDTDWLFLLYRVCSGFQWMPCLLIDGTKPQSHWTWTQTISSWLYHSSSMLVGVFFVFELMSNQISDKGILINIWL